MIDGECWTMHCQVGSFHSGGQRYMLMTRDAMMASHMDDNGPAAYASHSSQHVPDRSSFVYFDNSMHVIEPVSNEDTDIPFDSGIYLFI